MWIGPPNRPFAFVPQAIALKNTNFKYRKQRKGGKRTNEITNIKNSEILGGRRV